MASRLQPHTSHSPPYTHGVRPVLQVITCIALALPLIGCANTAALRRENDRLRAEVMELKSANDRLEGRVEELDAELTRESQRPDSLPAAVRANTPHVTALDLSRLCHVQDRDRDGRPDRLVLYVQPADSLGRFVQIVGTLTAHAAILPAAGEARTVGRLTLDPAALREAYRSSFTGTHYTVELPLETNELGDATELTARVIFTDGLTGRELTAERTVPLVIRP